MKKVFIRSGIRFDYLLADKDDTFFRELVQYHVSGQLRVAPEHVSDHVLRLMGKPENAVYRRFLNKYERLNRELGLDQYAVPYLMSSHPGSRLEDAIELAEHIRDMGYMPEQVQDFYPTPSTISTVMYYTGLDPRTMEPIYVPKDPREKAMQRALIQYRDPKNYRLTGPKCLIRPPKKEGGRAAGKQKTETNAKSLAYTERKAKAPSFTDKKTKKTAGTAPTRPAKAPKKAR